MLACDMTKINEDRKTRLHHHFIMATLHFFQKKGLKETVQKNFNSVFNLYGFT
jgi:hypothetical protein